MLVQSAIGLVVFLGLAWAMSEHRRKVSLRLVGFGLALQLALGILLLKVPGSGEIFLGFNRVILALEESVQAGTAFVFGYLGGGPPPFEEKEPSYNYVFAFRALPLLFLMSALSSLLFYWKVLPLVVKGFSRVLEKTLRLGGAEGLGVSANIFLGMVEAPLFIRPYLAKMTRSELFTVMTCGMATIAGTVMVLYASILSDIIPNVIGHILTASLLNAVAAVIISKIMIPETGPGTSGELVEPEPFSSSMDAITKGTLRGVQLLINIVAMLLVMVALIHLVNLILGVLPIGGSAPVTLQGILGIVEVGQRLSDALSRRSLSGSNLPGQEPGALQWVSDAYQETRRPSGKRLIQGRPAGTVIGEPSASMNEKGWAVSARSHLPSTTWPSANTSTRPSPVVSMVGRVTPPWGGVV